MDSIRDNLLEAPCGLHCGMCLLYRAGNDEALKSLLSKKFNISEEKLFCPGCRSVSGFCPIIDEQCATYLCAREKGVSFCSDCIGFPCRKLMPCADQASELPQNIKIYSLTLRKNGGAEEWRGSVMDMYALYFKGKMVIGHGPVPKE